MGNWFNMWWRSFYLFRTNYLRMKSELLKKMINKKEKMIEFALVTNLKNGNSFIFENQMKVNNEFKQYDKKIKFYFDKKINGIIKGTNIFIENNIKPIKVIIVGAVHITQYLVNFLKLLNFDLLIIDPRNSFASQQRFVNVEIINKWPNKALKKITTDKNTALITLTHDPKIDDPSILYALNNNFFYVGALGSKNTHKKRCLRLKKFGLKNRQLNKIFGPIGIKLGGRSAPEIALSIVTQLVLETYKKKNI